MTKENRKIDKLDSCLIEGMAKKFQEEGYLILRNAFSSQQLEEIGALVRSDPEVSRTWRKKFANGKPSVREVSNVYPRFPAIQEALASSYALEVVQKIIDQKLYLFRDAFIEKLPNPDSRFPLHQDSEFWGVLPESLVSMWIPLQKTDASNGVLAVVPGSHKKRYAHTVKVGEKTSLPKFVNEILRKSAQNANHVAGSEKVNLFRRFLMRCATFLNKVAIPFLSRYFKSFEKFTEFFVVKDDRTLWEHAVLESFEPGDVVVYHSLMLHGSGGNNSLSSRSVYIPTFMGADFTQNGIRVSDPALGFVPVKGGG